MKEGFAVLIGYQPCYVSFHRSNFRCIHAHGTQHLLTHIVDGKPPIIRGAWYLQRSLPLLAHIVLHAL